MRISLHARSILRRWKLGSYFYLYYSRYAATLSQIQLQRTKPHFGVHVEVRLDINFSSPSKKIEITYTRFRTENFHFINHIKHY